jgi:AcrR family transcriptional regulator
MPPASSASSATPAPRRLGRPRDAQADRAILDATRATLVELGWAKLTMGHVASRAGVAKTTLYRRWPNKGELVVDAVAALFDELDLPDLGCLRADIEGMVLSFATLLQLPETNNSLMAVVAEATRDPSLQARVRESIVDRQKRLVRKGRNRAQARGELPPGPTDPEGAEEDEHVVDLIFDVIAGAVVHRALISTAPVDRVWAERFATLLLGGLAAASPGGPPLPPAPPAPPAFS